MDAERLAEVRAMLDDLIDDGNWHVDERDYASVRHPDGTGIVFINTEHGRNLGGSYARHERFPDLAFIAAAPQIVRELLTEIDRLTTENVEIQIALADTIFRHLEHSGAKEERKVSALQRALNYALKIIRSYEIDMCNVQFDGTIRINAPHHGPSLADRGVCQGLIYLEARADIERIANDLR